MPRIALVFMLMLAVPPSVRAAQDAPASVPVPNVDVGGRELPALKKIRRRWNPILFSEGYVLGHIVQPTSEGLLIKFFNAEVLLGVNSVPSGVTDQICFERELQEVRARNLTPGTVEYSEAEQAAFNHCTDTVNPFFVSSYSTAWHDQAVSSENETLSLVRVTGYLVHPFLKSPYVLNELINVNADYALPSRYFDKSESLPVYSKVHYGISQIEGRIVIATMDGIVRKSYRLVLQVGNGGGRFVHVNVPNAALFDYIVGVMATGLPVRVYYYTLYGPQAAPSNLVKGYETNTRVFRVDVLSNQN